MLLGGISDRAEVALGSRKTLLVTPRGPLWILRCWALRVLVFSIPVLSGS